MARQPCYKVVSNLGGNYEQSFIKLTEAKTKSEIALASIEEALKISFKNSARVEPQMSTLADFFDSFTPKMAKKLAMSVPPIKKTLQFVGKTPARFDPGRYVLESKSDIVNGLARLIWGDVVGTKTSSELPMLLEVNRLITIWSRRFSNGFNEKGQGEVATGFDTHYREYRIANKISDFLDFSARKEFSEKIVKVFAAKKLLPVDNTLQDAVRKSNNAINNAVIDMKSFNMKLFDFMKESGIRKFQSITPDEWHLPRVWSPTKWKGAIDKYGKDVVALLIRKSLQIELRKQNPKVSDDSINKVASGFFKQLNKTMEYHVPSSGQVVFDGISPAQELSIGQALKSEGLSEPAIDRIIAEITDTTDGTRFFKDQTKLDVGASIKVKNSITNGTEIFELSNLLDENLSESFPAMIKAYLGKAVLHKATSIKLDIGGESVNFSLVNMHRDWRILQSAIRREAMLIGEDNYKRNGLEFDQTLDAEFSRLEYGLKIVVSELKGDDPLPPKISEVMRRMAIATRIALLGKSGITQLEEIRKQFALFGAVKMIKTFPEVIRHFKDVVNGDKGQINAIHELSRWSGLGVMPGYRITSAETNIARGIGENGKLAIFLEYLDNKMIHVISGLAPITATMERSYISGMLSIFTNLAIKGKNVNSTDEMIKLFNSKKEEINSMSRLEAYGFTKESELAEDMHKLKYDPDILPHILKEIFEHAEIIDSKTRRKFSSSEVDISELKKLRPYQYNYNMADWNPEIRKHFSNYITRQSLDVISQIVPGTQIPELLHGNSLKSMLMVMKSFVMVSQVNLLRDVRMRDSFMMRSWLYGLAFSYGLFELNSSINSISYKDSEEYKERARNYWFEGTMRKFSSAGVSAEVLSFLSFFVRETPADEYETGLAPLTLSWLQDDLESIAILRDFALFDKEISEADLNKLLGAALGNSIPIVLLKAIINH